MGNLDAVVRQLNSPPRVRRQACFPTLFAVKNYILDTNVLLHDPNSLVNFEEHNVLVPIEVIEEIDRFKRESTELGRNARTVSRMLDGFRGEGSLSAGVDLPNGGKLKIAFHKNGHGETIFTQGFGGQPHSRACRRHPEIAAEKRDDPGFQRHQFAHQGQRARFDGGGL